MKDRPGWDTWHERVRCTIEITPFYWGWRYEYNLQSYVEVWAGPVFVRIGW